MSKPRQTQFKLVELSGYREIEIAEAPTLEEIEEVLQVKTGKQERD